MGNIASEIQQNPTTFFQMWFATTIWYTVGIGSLYLLCGFLAAFVFRRKLKVAVLIPLVGTSLGLFIGFCEGAVYALAVALIYLSGPFIMLWYTAAAWGLGLAVFYLSVSFIRMKIQW